MAHSKPLGRRFGHEYIVSRQRGLAKVTCSCGIQSDKIQPEEVSVWIESHRRKFGLIEKEKKHT